MADIKSLYTKKKKKVKTNAKPIGNLQIIDDDISLNDLTADNIENTIEEEPVIAEIVDERPEIIKQLEHYTADKWKKISTDGDIQIKLEPIDEPITQKINNDDADDQDLDMIPRKRTQDKRKPIEPSLEIKIKQEPKDKNEEKIDETRVRVRNKTVKEKEEQARKEERNLKYMEWGKGIKQKKNFEEKLASDLYEAQKPLARYRDDKDLDKLLRQTVREGDTMLSIINSENQGNDNDDVTENPKKRYKGTVPPNRYGILPGYRWDGVDRSNGFEKKYFESLSNKKAREAEPFKWSIEDM